MDILTRLKPARALIPTRRHLFAPLIAGAMAASTGAHAQSYSVVDLGTLAQGTSTVVRGPNIAGAAVGGGRLVQRGGAVRPPEALVLERGATQAVAGPGGSDLPRLLGINDLGAVVGAANAAQGVRAFAGTRSGAARELPPLPGDVASLAYAINNRGEAVGFSSGAGGERAVRWTPDGQPSALLAAPGAASARAYCVNERGDSAGVVGTAGERRPAFWAAGGTATELPLLPGFEAGEAAWLNSRGDTVGYVATNAEQRRATLWPAGGAPVDLSTLPGHSTSQAFGINDAGAVVGSSDGGSGTKAFVWSSAAGMRDLNALLASPTNVVLTKAIGINNAGMIVALGHEPEPGHAADSHDHEQPIRVVLLVPGG
jgi:probable HAF family extracellular repeat protein